MDIQHPIVQSVLIPIAIAGALTGVIRFTFGETHGKALAAAAPGIALLAAWLLVLGLPPWPPRSALEKLPMLLGLPLVIGFVMDTAPPNPAGKLATGVALLLVSYAWFASPQLARFTATDAMLLAGAAFVACVIMSGISLAEPASVNVPTMLVVAGLGLAAVAFNAGSLKLFQLSLALAAAVGGYAIWNWPKPRYAFGAAGVLGPGLSLLLLAMLTLLLTKVRPLALLLLALVFGVGFIVRRIPMGRLDRRVVEPLLITLLAAIPAVAAALLAQPAAPAGDDPYYH